MRYAIGIVCALPVLFGLGSAGLAADRPDGGPRGGAGFFDRLDADKSGSLSKSEFTERQFEAFDRLDANKDGQVDKDEWAQRPSRGDMMFGRLDADDDGTLTEKEYATSRGDLFDRLDANKDNTLVKDEIKGPRRGGADRQDKMFGTLDKDADGKITRKEFEGDRFARLDENADGSVTKAEWQSMRERNRKDQTPESGPAN